MKIIRRILLGLVALIVLAALALLSLRAYRQHQISQAIRITTPNGIDEARFINVNGADEWITIRGDDRRNPVILFLHGGPSEANSPLPTLYLPYEKDFVFVQWDQPGAGKTYIRAGDHQPKLTFDGMATDGVAVAEYLRGYLHANKIILTSQDTGGLIALRMIRQRPELFSAFVGSGQSVSWLAGQDLQYEYTRNRATAANDQQALAALAKIGPPPYRELARYREFGEYFDKYWPAEDAAVPSTLTRLVVDSPKLSLREFFGWVKALRTGEDAITSQLITDDIRSQPSSFSIPVFFIQGENDIISPTSLVAQYVSQVQAPAKGLQVVPHAGHMVMWTHPAEFLDLLHADLRQTR